MNCLEADGTLEAASSAVNECKVIRLNPGRTAAFTRTQFDGQGTIALPDFINIYIERWVRTLWMA